MFPVQQDASSYGGEIFLAGRIAAKRTPAVEPRNSRKIRKPPRRQERQAIKNSSNREPREINEQFFKRIFPVSVLAGFSHVLRFSLLIAFVFSVFSAVKNLGVLCPPSVPHCGTTENGRLGG
jgi:hypothetical protein